MGRLPTLPWSEAVDNFIANNYLRMLDKDIADKLNALLGTHFTQRHVAERRERVLGLPKGGSWEHGRRRGTGS